MKKIRKIIVPIVFLLIAITIFSFLRKDAGKEKEIVEIPYSKAISMIDDSKAEKVTLIMSTLELNIEFENKVYTTIIPDTEAFTNYMMKYPSIEYSVLLQSEESKSTSTIWSIFSTAFSVFVPIIFIIILLNIVMKKFGKSGSGGFDLSKSLTGEDMGIEPVKDSNVSFDDVAGIDEEKFELQEVVEMLKNPEKFREIGAEIPKGVLLVGDPGTGKTLMAKATATEAGVNFYQCSGSTFENVFVGLGASKIRKLFADAKKNAPAIIFIDEIDSVAKGRYNVNSHNEQTLNQLLSEMDGFDETTNIIVIAATNHPEVLDSAVTRPGRFDRIINIPLPDKEGRQEILEVHAKGKKFAGDLKEIIKELSKKTSGMSGAELKNILNEAAIVAVRNGHKLIENEDIDEAFIKVIIGVSKGGKEISDSEKELVAYHEAGHAIASRILRPDREILEVSIIPRGTAGGYTLFADSDEKLPREKDFLDSIGVSLGGRAAEEVKYSTISIGASSDLQHATETAHRMIYRFAMGKSGGQLVKLPNQEDYNNNLERKMFSSMEDIIKDSYDKVLEIMKNNSYALERLKDELIAKSTLDSKELESIFAICNV